jgi:hypothetical protein
MIYRIVLEDLRHHFQQTLLNALGMVFAVMIMLLIAGTTVKPVLSYAVTLVFKLTLVSMLLLGLAVDLCFLTINRFSQVREKVHQFAILRVLGAPPSFFYIFQLQETTLLLITGTLGGILLTCGVRSALTLIVPDTFAFKALYDLWPWIGIIPAGAFYAAGIFATDSINGGDLVKALSDKE